jgi:hypothetical protein
MTQVTINIAVSHFPEKLSLSFFLNSSRIEIFKASPPMFAFEIAVIMIMNKRIMIISGSDNEDGNLAIIKLLNSNIPISIR